MQNIIGIAYKVSVQQWLKVKDAVWKNGVSQSVPRKTGGMEKRLYLPKLRHYDDENLHGDLKMDRVDCGIIILFNSKR